MNRNAARRFLLGLLLMGWPWSLRAAEESWVAALRAMPVPPVALNRSNAADVLLGSLQSNAVVNAIVVLPGVSDDFYLIHRDAPPLNLRATNLWASIVALTNATAMRVTWREPFVLLHARASDLLEPSIQTSDAAIAARLRRERVRGRVLHLDAHWEVVQPALERAWGRTVRPQGTSTDAWHFNRHNLAGWNLTGWELLEAISLTGGTRVSVQNRGIDFQIRGTP